ncbi:ABC transporter permease [Paenalcaligenes niemegkensis]|uniref:ABC transporter permease n=1 Tax=Paenalcaligenes niemegkensis TaxID=2895469 RepID=UPI001EE7938C|nr:ABC transporter permease [Paenalcaligenes niemegkensis]MCQ9615737.1 ABC transporter permease [Paenalcaligenes niemegkensis]
MKLLQPIDSRLRIALGVSFFALFLAFWTILTVTGMVSPYFLASPVQTIKAGWILFAEFDFIHDVGMTVWRVLGGFFIASVIAVPLGILMGAYKPIEAVFEPFVSFARYLPASAFIPLLIVWVGIGEAQKLSIIFLGCFFQLTLMVMMIVSNARRDLVEAAYTLGSTDSGVVRRVLLPGAAPEIAEALRQVLGLGWTYVVVAELIAAASGIGHMIMDSQALMATDNIIAGIVLIGIIGLTSDVLFKKLNQTLFPWSLMR